MAESVREADTVTVINTGASRSDAFPHTVPGSDISVLVSTGSPRASLSGVFTPPPLTTFLIRSRTGDALLGVRLRTECLPSTTRPLMVSCL